VASSSSAQTTSIPVERFELTGAVVGRVCRDQNENGRCEDGEPGLGGVRVVLETGQAALTDLDGRYHLAAAEARAPDRQGGRIRLLTGRHRVALDPRGLGAGESATPPAATVELPMGGTAIQSFAVRGAAEAARPVEAGYGRSSPAARLEGPDRLRYQLAGQAGPGDEVTVAGETAEVDPDGAYRAMVELKPGLNRVPLTVASASGAVRYLVQSVELIRRPGELLVVPRGLALVATVQLPARRGEVAAAGTARLRLEAAPGTRVGHPGGEVVVGPSGEVQVPVELRPGRNEVKLQLSPPGQPAREAALAVMAAFRPLVVALLDLDGGWLARGGGLAAEGRAAAHAELDLGGWELSGEVDLSDEDLAPVLAGAPSALLLPRRPERAERSLDPELFLLAWGDRSLGSTPNHPGGRLRFEARNPDLGRVGYGPYRASLEDSEVGRFARVLYGPYLELKAPVGPVTLGVEAFGAPGLVDPTRPVSTAPVHQEFESTSGSVFFLGAGPVVEGSETVRVELRDGLTGLPLSERHLVRGRDYELDWLSGRLLLSRPLSFLAGPAALASDALAAGTSEVLVVDYEQALLGAPGRQTLGAGLSAAVGPVQVAGGVAHELAGASRYLLLRAQGSVALGPMTLGAEAARSSGEAIAPEAFQLSDDGGLTTVTPTAAATGGEALSVWLRGKGLFDRGRVDAAFRFRSPGFSDRSHHDRWLHRQLSLRVDQPLGDLLLSALADARASGDPRMPFGDQTIASRTLAGSAGYRLGPIEARLEARDSELTAAVDPLRDVPVLGGRTSAGAAVRWHALPELQLTAAHLQTLATRGEGLGARADTFSSVGAEVSLRDAGTFGARAGWGPELGPLAWVHGEHRSGADLYYGSYSVDVDGPAVGAGRAISGARSELGGGTSAFVEDVAAHDAAGVRLGRAVGVTHLLGNALQLQGRYERGARHPLGVAWPFQRDAAGISAALIQPWLRLFARGELRLDRGAPARDPLRQVDLRQHLVSAAAEVDLPLGLQLSGRGHWSETFEAGSRTSGFLESTASLAYRADAWMAILRYSLTRELPPGGLRPERAFQIASFVPALRIADRVTLWGGVHAGWSSEAAQEGLVLSASLRPAVQVVGGLEVAGEVARRSADLDGGELTAVRGEAGWRFGDRMYLGLGYTFLGFNGTGVVPPAAGERHDRLYARAEMAL
jgi:hypothetical protein